MRIMRMESEIEGFLPPPSSLRSRSWTRASSLWTRSLRSPTFSSVIGAMLDADGEQRDLTKVAAAGAS